MSVVGIDFGNLNLLIAQTSKGGVDVILNESSNRQTATAVSIQGKQRFLGDAGAAMARSNVKNTVNMFKLLVGRKFDDPAVQKELARVPYKTAKMPSGGVGIVVTYNDEPLTISAEHFFAIMLVKAQQIATAANGGVNIGDAVLAVPHWFTETQRRGIFHACEIAGLNCLKIANESTMIALSYGIFKSAKNLFSETDPFRVMFIDIGYTGYCASIVDFVQGNMRMRAAVCDREVGGRDFDHVIIEYLAEVFQKKTGIDVRNNKKALLKLEAAAEKAKKNLSPAGVNESNVSVECLAEDTDLSTILKREELESRSAHLIARLEAVIVQALTEAGVTKEEVHEVEVVGGASRVAIIKRTLATIMGLDTAAMNYGLKTTMNADEAVARGCALQCAIVSSRMKVKPFNIIDTIPYGIVLKFDSEADSDATSEEGSASSGGSGSVQLFVRGDELPHKPRRVTFRNKTADFGVTVSYDDLAVSDKPLISLPSGETATIAHYTFKIPAPTGPAGSPIPDVRITWGLDKNGFLYVQSAQILEEIPQTEEELAAAAAAAAAPPAEGAPAPEAPKKKFKKIDIQYTAEYPGLTSAERSAAIELEASMAYEDKLITETADRRNDLETYIYNMRDKIESSNSPLKPFVAEAERASLPSQLTAAEDWLYNEGFDCSKQEYIRKLEELRVTGDLIERRYTESQNRPDAIDSLKKQIEMCKAFASKYDEARAHITEDERDKVRKAVQQTEEWMYDMIGKQGDLPSYKDPILTVQLITAKRNELFGVANPVMQKPKPKPAATEPAPASSTTPPAPTSEDKKTPEGDATETEPMDQAKGGPEEDGKAEEK